MKPNILTAVILASTFLFSCEQDECTPPPTEKTVTLQPGTTNGKDAFVAYSAGSPASNDFNLGNEKTLDTYAWTNAGFIQSRSLVSFPLDSIPANAEILSARLTIYGASTSIFTPQGNSGDNKLYIQRIIQSWSESAVTWNNQPATTTEFQIETTASTTQWSYNLSEIDVTMLVKLMRVSGNNFGFLIRLVNEQTYRSIVFSTSEADDATKRPRLTVTYKN